MKDIAYRTLINEAAAQLSAQGIPEAESDVMLLAEHFLGLDLTSYLMKGQDLAPAKEAALFREAVSRRLQHIPVQYITHTAWFMGYPFYVDETVLIPRQDTETPAREAIRRLKENMPKSPRVLDLCTGSGSLAAVIAMQDPSIQVDAVDLSKEACRTAEKNFEKLKVSGQVHLYCQDLYGEKDEQQTGPQAAIWDHGMEAKD